jgi:hypothetical protein
MWIHGYKLGLRLHLKRVSCELLTPFLRRFLPVYATMVALLWGVAFVTWTSVASAAPVGLCDERAATGLAATPVLPPSDESIQQAGEVCKVSLKQTGIAPAHDSNLSKQSWNDEHGVSPIVGVPHRPPPTMKSLEIIEQIGKSNPGLSSASGWPRGVDHPPNA